MKTDVAGINAIFEKAEKEGRNFLLEHEVYAVLNRIGVKTPKFFFLKKGDKPDRKKLAVLKSDKVVLKVVCPLIAHKTDVGGVAFVENNAAEVQKACRRMLAEVPGRFQEWNKAFTHEKDGKVYAIEEIEREIRGILVLEKVKFEEAGFGSELLLGLRNTREFGPVVTMGAGGVDVEYLGERLKEGKSVAMRSVHLLKKGGTIPALEPLAVYDKLVKEFRGRSPLLVRDELAEAFYRFARLGEAFSPFSRRSRYVIEEAEINPFVVVAGKLVPLDGLVKFSRNKQDLSRRPFEQLEFLLHPKSIGIIGVSEKMNMGHIILNNVLREGFPRERVFVVKPGLVEIEGCRCVPAIADLPETMDLFVLTLPAEQSLAVMSDLTAAGKARSVIIIAGGMGEKKGTEGLEGGIKKLLEEGRKAGRLTPVVNGGNCMGITSQPGSYDTTFIAEYKLAKPSGKNRRAIYISQSGAFLICRQSKCPAIEPLYSISLGNQLDMTASDYLNYFTDKTPAEADVYAVYIEGFRPGDGLTLARAAAELIKKGKKVVSYKAGRSSEGRAATSSHTASVAGDYAVCRTILEGIGVFVAEDLFEFESAVKGLVMLGKKKVRGNRAALISNAGFECVIMADNLKNAYALKAAEFSDETKAKLTEVMASLGIDRLQDIHNPLDLTPVATDPVFAGCVKAILEDEGVDCAVVSPVPMTTALQTVVQGEGHSEDIRNPGSLGMRLIEIFNKTEKPFVVNIDAGAIYDPLAGILEEAGIPVFRRSDEALRFLRKFVSVCG